MFGWRKTDPELEEAIAAVYAEMKQWDPYSEEYQESLESLERLEKLKAGEGRRRISSDTLIQVGGNLLGILIIVAYERGHVMVSKAKDYVMRPH